MFLQNQVDFLRLGSVQKVHPDIQPYVACNAAKHIKTVKELKNFYESKVRTTMMLLFVYIPPSKLNNMPGGESNLRSLEC